MRYVRRDFWMTCLAWSAACLGLCSVTGIVSAAELTAGVARIDITPPLDLKAPLGGYGERMNRPAEGVEVICRTIAPGIKLFQTQHAIALGVREHCKTTRR